MYSCILLGGVFYRFLHVIIDMVLGEGIEPTFAAPMYGYRGRSSTRLT